MTAAWDCEAYGPDGPAASRLCYFADPGTRNCGSAAECAASVAGARRLLFAAMRDRAASGDPAAVRLAADFTSPDQPLRWPVTPGELPYVDRGLAPVLFAQPVYSWGYVSVKTIFDHVYLKKDVPEHVQMDLIRVSKDNLGEWARQLKSWGFSDVDAKYLALPK
jgi:hypothetical protein